MRCLAFFLLVFVTVGVSGCSRYISSPSPDFSTVDSDVSSPPTDGPRDTTSPDASSTDAHSPDLGPRPTLSCAPPELVGSGGPATPSDFSEVALREDGLVLIGKGGSFGWYESTRPGRRESFGPWTAIGFPHRAQQDPSFFTDDDGEELTMVAEGTLMNPRELLLCRILPNWKCDPIAVTLEGESQPTTFDMDGPQVVVLPSGALLMAHNISRVGHVNGEVYVAYPTTHGNPYHWTTKAVWAPGVKGDDPALSPDGLVLLFSRPGSDGDRELWVSRRASLDEDFPEPMLLESVNTAAEEREPYLAPVSGDPNQYELFFSSNRDGLTSKIYRTICALY